MKKGSKGPRKNALIVSAVVLMLFALGWWMLHGVYMPVLQPSGTIAKSEQQLIIFTVILSAIVVIPVFILLIVFAWRYREGNEKATYKPEWSNNRTLELIWWGIPIAIIALLGTVTWISTHSLDPYRSIKSSTPSMEIDVVALQWKWLFIYPKQKLVTVNQIVVPVNQPIHFRLTADAPMSAFWVPALGSQIYTMNGMSSTLNLMATSKGDYEGYNTNINGPGYSDMKFTVHAVDNKDYDAWVNKSATALPFDKPMYDALARPSTSGPKVYTLVDTDLYDQVLAKYMEDHPTTDTHNTQNAGGA